MASTDYTTLLFRLASPQFLFLSAFRQKVRKGVRVDLEDVAADLEQIFEDQRKEARTDPRLDTLYEKARYPLVVMADEILLHSGWEFSPQWQDRIFEEKLFNTNIGGDQYFAIAKDLRPEDVELASIVYAGFALGFRGRYRERPEKLAEARKKVYRILAEYLATESDKITPEAYHVTAQSQKKLNPVVTLGRVAIIGVGALFMYYVITFLIWSSLISDLRTAAAAMKLVS